MIGLIGKKLGMTRRFDADGRSVPVTVIEAGPCVVTQVKTSATDGYDAVQLGYGAKKPKNTPLPMQGHFRKAGTAPLRTVCEYRLQSEATFKLGETVGLAVLEGADKVDVTGTTKGRGFAGRIKRHGHHRGPAAHGTKNVRETGGTGMHESPGRVLPGTPMAGQYGNKQETKKNLKVVAIDKERNLLLVCGSVPGHKNGIVFIRPSR
ncbi:MAG: 50S ribosomal protein L3 [Candidatus Krumholzibacteria bacterium]|jgi:large subunit ribosomal protein L3|nr:50S ribosomal protein L3 [Candidatus Krumholzibacteria bacterium]